MNKKGDVNITLGNLPCKTVTFWLADLSLQFNKFNFKTKKNVYSYIKIG